MQIANINRMRRYVSKGVLKTVIHCLITNRLDYCNVLLHGAPSRQLQWLQKIQNVTARMITDTARHEHITPILRNLHWLPIEQRVKYKVILTIYKILTSRAPSYLCDLISVHESRRALRASSVTLDVPFTSSDLMFRRAFRIAGPRLWNSLPDWIRNTDSFSDFKTQLKTFLFRQHFN